LYAINTGIGSGFMQAHMRVLLSKIYMMVFNIIF